MSTQPSHVIESRDIDGPFETRDEAWEFAQHYASRLRARGMTPEYGVNVERRTRPLPTYFVVVLYRVG